MVELTHNFDGKKFMWLYAKYATGCNPAHHCTGAIKGRYSKRFSRLNSDFKAGQTIVLDEFPNLGWDAIYICGVSTNGYRKHENYPRNVHVAIIPKEGCSDHWEFEGWTMDIENGVFECVQGVDGLDLSMRSCLPSEYITCRMFRWAVMHYPEDVEAYAKQIVRETGYNYCIDFCHGHMDSLRNDYIANLGGDTCYGEEEFVKWVVECLRDGDAVAETFFGELHGTLNEWVIDYLGWPDAEFEEGVERYIKEHFPNAK